MWDKTGWLTHDPVQIAIAATVVAIFAVAFIGRQRKWWI